MDARAPEVIGNPVRRDLLLRALRSNVNATILGVWTVLVAAVGVFVLIDQLGLSRPFDTGAATGVPVGRALAQWWVISITAGMSILAPVTTVVACAGRGERRRLQGWAMTLVGPWRVVLGIFQQQLALILLALALALPVAGIALAFGGTSVAQLGVGVAGAALVGVLSSALAAALACRSTQIVRPLTAVLIVVIAWYGAPFVAHQVRAPLPDDAVLAVVPVVAVADAAVPRAPRSPSTAEAADAPLDHLAATVATTGDALPRWAASAAGAVLATLVLLVVTRSRITRPPRR